MTRNMILAALACTTLAAPALANGCGTEPGPTGTTTLPNGAVIIAQPIWFSGIGSDGEAVQNNQKGCGETAIYVYTGGNPTSDIQLWAKLDPVVVNPNVAQVKCAAPSLDHTADVYYLGYAAADWPYEFHANANSDQFSYNGNAYTLVHVYNPYGIKLAPYTTYTVSLVCPPNG